MRLRLTSLTSEDQVELSRMWKLYWSDKMLPSTEQSIVNSVVKNEEGRIIGYGTVHHFAEAMLFLDPAASQRDRALAVKLLMFEAFRGVERSGLSEIVALIEDPDFATLIEKHFGFEKTPRPTEVLMKRM